MAFLLLRESRPVARKDHSCVWCGEKILKGEKYYSRTYTFEGMQTDKTHSECKEAMNKIDWHYYDGGFEGGQYKRGLPEFKNGEEMMTRKTHE